MIQRKQKQLFSPVNELFLCHVFNGIVIEIKEKAKYLGVTLDRKLSWREHIRNRINSAKQYSTKLMCAAKCTWALYAVPVWIAALNKKYIVRLLRSVQRLSLILIRKSFRTAQTEGLTALEEVLPVDLRAKELTIMRYAKTGRLEYRPEASAPVIPMSSRIKSLCIDEVITVFLDVHSDDSSNLFPLDRRKLKIALYEKWHQGFTNGVCSWPLLFFPTKDHLIAASKMNITHQLTQIITGYCWLNYFLNKTGKDRSREYICGESKTFTQFLFTCPVYFYNVLV